MGRLGEARLNTTPSVTVTPYATSDALARSQDALLADSDLRIYGPTGHAIAGMAQLALQSSLPLSSPGRVTISDDYGPGVAAGGWTSPPPPPATA